MRRAAQAVDEVIRDRLFAFQAHPGIGIARVAAALLVLGALQNRHLGAALGRTDGGGKPGPAMADHDDVKIHPHPLVCMQS